jgi:hypothetical protein
MKMGMKKRENGKGLAFKNQLSRSSSLVSTAYHEAGHAVMAYFEDIRNKGASIEPEGDATGICRLKNILFNINPKKDGTLRMRDKIERLARVKLAGPIAQRLFSPAHYRHFHGQEDRQGAIDLLSYLADSKEELEAYLKLLHIQVITKIESPVVWKAIKTVANHLLKTTSLSGRELKKVIVQSIHGK